jgi:asparagine synthase (glutamine-hydrolysing)
MSNEDGSIHVIHNGEIYNYKELKEILEKKGHRFRSASDTEVIIHGYEEYGACCVDYFNGMFGFALWDSSRELFFAARDRIGIKPFYYFFNGKSLIFGSEIKALLCHPDVTVTPDFDTIRQYLLFNHSVNEKTWYCGIKQLPPGSYMMFDGKDLVIKGYWDVRFDVDYGRSFDSFVDELRPTLEDAVKLHLRSDVPVGAYLSGGIDSSTVVALATREIGRNLHTFSAAFDEGKDYDERPYIRIVSERFGTLHHEVIPTSADLPRLLPTLLWHLDEPVIGPAILPMFRVCGLVANSGIKVVNGGQGGDELFAGYPPFYVMAARSLLAGLHDGSKKAPLREMVYLPEYLVKGGAINRLVQRLRGSGGTPSWVRGPEKVREEIKHRWREAIPEHLAGNPFEEMTYMGIKYYLAGLLQQEDRISMAWSIESRVPLLDFRIVEFSAKIPSWMKVRGGVLKCVLREAMRGIVPDAILDRKDKMGYPTPVSRWFSDELKDYLVDVLTSKPLLCGDIVDPSAVSTMVNSHISRQADYGAILWSVLNLELWMRGLVAGWPDVPRCPA